MSFNLQPTLEGRLLRLRPLALDDFEDLYKASSDPLIWDQHPYPRYEQEAFKEFFQYAIESKGSLVIIDNSSKEIIGTSRYYNLTDQHVYIGYTFLTRSHWGGVFNRELKSLMLNHAFKKFDKVFFDIGVDNMRSCRAIEKIGGQFVKNQELKGKPYTLYVLHKPK